MLGGINYIIIQSSFSKLIKIYHKLSCTFTYIFCLQEMTTQQVRDAGLSFPKTYNWINHIMLDTHKVFRSVSFLNAFLS